MHSLTTILFSSAILSLAAAAPSPDIWRGCHNDKKFYSCYGNGFRGCCSVDPCNLSTCPDVVTPSATPSAAPSCTPGKHRAYLPDTYAIFPDKPNDWRNQSSTYHVSQALNGENKRDTLLRFKLPAAAKNCGLSWQQPLQGSNFAYFNTGFVEIYDVKNYKSGVTGNADFTFWPEMPKYDEHSSGAGYCAEEVLFWTSLVGSPKGAEGSVVMGQSGEVGKENGWYLSYEC
ncbi:hypothetical protein P154DRAFT_439203 [Amniculicola lignicola CBS 123094]|uniref:Uncharacterized protein n=1 Tax=Amniculicola lignicola CBS 123094 TaxID=1392246 RepID=A0A6A5W957_9PLEO|nr:hypothetical protein P154DRAFT_439203 [Amniculicola lignicola CBS 123094]